LAAREAHYQKCPKQSGDGYTFGLPPRMVKEYARQLLAALEQTYGSGRRSGFERFAREEQHSISQCPIRPCSCHAEHLHLIAWEVAHEG